MATLRGKAYWAKVHEPVPNYFDATKIEYSINVGHLTDEDKEFLTGLNLGNKIKTDKKGVMGEFIEFKARNSYTVTNKQTGEKELREVEIPVVDKDLNPISPDVLIANDSEVIVSFNVRPWEFGGRSGTTADLKAVQVIDLAEYIPNADPLADFKEAADFSA